MPPSFLEGKDIAANAIASQISMTSTVRVAVGAFKCH